jgi:hypothetical protein
LVVSEKTGKDKVELKERDEEKTEILEVSRVIERFC